MEEIHGSNTNLISTTTGKLIQPFPKKEKVETREGGSSNPNSGTRGLISKPTGSKEPGGAYYFAQLPIKGNANPIPGNSVFETLQKKLRA